MVVPPAPVTALIVMIVSSRLGGARMSDMQVQQATAVRGPGSPGRASLGVPGIGAAGVRLLPPLAAVPAAGVAQA